MQSGIARRIQVESVKEKHTFFVILCAVAQWSAVVFWSVWWMMAVRDLHKETTFCHQVSAFEHI